jgi:methylmalonyl-CoA/ethylmalonyl-CoA epimerase
MQSIPQVNPTFGKLHHVGVVVKDMDKAIARLESMGLGPFKGRGDVKWGAITFKGELRGKPGEWKTKISNGQMGDVQLELLEPAEGAQALKESLDETGEGLHHIGFLSDDVDADIARGLKQGFKIWTSSKRPDGKTSFVYFLPTEIGKIAIEIRMRNP